MTASNLEQVTALPVSGNVDKAALRALLTRRTPLTLGATETLADFIVTDPASGVIPQFVIQNGTIYEYDSLDTTTVASAICLVSGDTTGLRYKTGGITPPYSVLTVGTTAQPASPAVGDAYLIPVAATGTDWAGQDGKVGIYSRAGWQFAVVPVGRGLYAEDTNIRWYRNAAGTWVSGFGAVNVGAGGINITNMLGAKASFVVKVENQTTTTAPASPVAFVAYIVAGSGGVWSGYSVGDVAMCLADGVWTRIVPATGDVVYDKLQSARYQWNGAAWIEDAGKLLDRVFLRTTSSDTIADTGSGGYIYSDTVAPAGQLRSIDPAQITFSAKAIGNKIAITWQGKVTPNAAAISLEYTAALYIDSVSDSLDYRTIYIPLNAAGPLRFEWEATDASPHTFKMAFMRLPDDGATSQRINSMQRRTMLLEEFG